MSLIKNLIKEPETKKKIKSGDEAEDSDEKPKTVRPVIKSVTDLQRLRLEKLMKNPEKPVQIPESRGSRSAREEAPPAFVRNVMGSSAGAGSGEFHVYRHLRRKEYARQKNIQIKSYHEQLDQDYQEKLEENRRIAEEKTAKKRAKRLKKKQRAKHARKGGSGDKPQENAQELSSSSEESHDEEQDAGKALDAKEGENRAEKVLKVCGEDDKICTEDNERSNRSVDTSKDGVKEGDKTPTVAETPIERSEISQDTVETPSKTEEKLKPIEIP